MNLINTSENNNNNNLQNNNNILDFQEPNHTKNPEDSNNQNNNINIDNNISQELIQQIKKEENIPNQTPLKGLINASNNNINSFIAKSNSKISNFLNKTENINNNTNNNLIEKSDLNIFNVSEKDDFTYLEPDLEIIKKYQHKLNPMNITQNIAKFYSKKGQEINNYSEYYEDMKNYFTDIAKKEKNKLLSKNWNNSSNINNNVASNNINNNTNVNQINRRKIIFIHDSAMQIRSVYFFILKI